MNFTNVLNLSSEVSLFNENLFSGSNHFIFSDYNYLILLSDYTSFNAVKLFDDADLYSKTLLTYINQIDDLDLYDNLENITSIYHYSIPNVKLSYPEPFIASPSFMHTDL